MKKETTNTFDGGMIRDLHPLTTPNNVLTDALNATLITYNGNEKILQNDMGNTRVGTAFLPSGYVPVGMKEHGGVIYVAAYNPFTNKGLIGSYPSPLLLWEGEEWSVNAPAALMDGGISFDSSDFYNRNHIHTEVVQKYLFRCSDGTFRTLHPGDKFSITIANAAQLKSDADYGYITLLLGVVKSDGGIEVMKEYKLGSTIDDWFLQSGNAIDNITSNNYKVFSASSSGVMILIVIINTLDSFNLIREYSLDNDKIVVTFKGEGTKDRITYNTVDNSSYIKLFDMSNNDLAPTTITEPNNPNNLNSNVVNYNIAPMLIPQGIVDRMARKGLIDFAKIRKSEDDFHEWRFFVTDKYIKIGWAYEFYNLNQNKLLTKISMEFRDLIDGPNGTPEIVDLVKDYYSGNFEEYIYFLEHPSIMPKHIYIVDIIKYLTDGTTETSEIVACKMLYVSKLYNKYYNSIYDSNLNNIELEKVVEFKPLSLTIDANINITPNLKYKVTNSKIRIKSPKDERLGNEKSPGQITSSSYITYADDLLMPADYGVGTYEYVTRIENEYSGEVDVTCDVEIDKNYKDEIIGVINPNLINTVLSQISIDTSNSSISVSSEDDDDELRWIENVEVSLLRDDKDDLLGNDQISNERSITISQSKVIDGDIAKISGITFKDSRYIIGASSLLKESNSKIQGLMPVYSPKYSSLDRLRVFASNNYKEPLIISGSDENGFFANSTLKPDGSIVNGIDVGAGYDDSGLDGAAHKVNEVFIPTFNMFGGDYGDHARLYFKGVSYYRLQSGQFVYWPCTEDEESDEVYTDYNDNYLIVTMKFTDGSTRFVHLITPKTWKGTNDTLYPRADVLLKCLLSLLFIVQEKAITSKYITTTDADYAYLDGTTNINLALSLGSLGDEARDIMYSYDSGTYSLNYILTNTWNVSNGKISRRGKLLDFTNLIPTVNATAGSLNDIPVSIDDKFDLDKYLKFYLGSSLILEDTFEQVNGVNVDPGTIYMIDTSLDVINKAASTRVKQGQGFSANIDGAYEWSTIPAVKPVTDNLELFYRWDGYNGGDNKFKFKYLATALTTKAAYELLHKVTVEDPNELLGNYGTEDNYRSSGNWALYSDEPAPDLFYRVLYSPYYSLFKFD